MIEIKLPCRRDPARNWMASCQHPVAPRPGAAASTLFASMQSNAISGTIAWLIPRPNCQVSYNRLVQRHYDRESSICKFVGVLFGRIRVGRETLLEHLGSQGRPGGRAGRSVGDDVIRSCLDRSGRARTSPNPVEPGPGRVLASGTVGGGGSARNPARPAVRHRRGGRMVNGRLMHVRPAGRRAAVAGDVVPPEPCGYTARGLV